MNEVTRSDGQGRKFLMLLASVLTVVALSFVLPFSGMLFSSPVVAQDKAAPEAITDAQQGFDGQTNPRSNYWRAVREGVAGYSTVKGTDANVLINNGGQNWRAARNGPIFYWGWILLAAAVAGIALFWLLRGRIKLEHGRSGVKIKRWGGVTRLLHWLTAITFILLAATGLSLFYGRAVMIPLIGKDAFAAWAGLAKLIHNYVGPVFAATLVLLLLLLVVKNIPNGRDLKWFLKGGGMIGKSHPSAGFMNGGEKVWYWLLATVGLAVVLSGLAMNFLTDLSRTDSQLAMTVHAIGSIVIMAVSLGHIYIGTAGTEGALEGMTTGEVDINWARQHHDAWVDELERKGKVQSPATQAHPAVPHQRLATDSFVRNRMRRSLRPADAKLRQFDTGGVFFCLIQGVTTRREVSATPLRVWRQSAFVHESTVSIRRSTASDLPSGAQPICRHMASSLARSAD